MKNFALLAAALLSVNGVYPQCTITSSHGWTATVEVIPTEIVPEFTNCPWYYHYEVRFDYIVTFSGSNTGRSVNGNFYFNCTGGSGGTPYRPMGNVNSNTTATSITNNNTRQYNAVGPAYNYGSNPDCNSVTVADAGCASVRLDYWGSGVSGGSVTCATSAPLPIELLKFAARAEKGNVLLDWKTASEINNEYFTIERSDDLRNWEAIGRVDGAGNSNTIRSYEWVDVHPSQGQSYYRLKQTDFNGAHEYSQIVTVSLSLRESVQIYPNPAQKQLFIRNNIKPVRASLFTEIGTPVKRIFTQDAELEFTMDINDLIPGMYLLELIYESETIVEKVMIR